MLSRERAPVLVTGAAGFVGTNVVRGLAALGRPVIALDRTASDQLTRWFLGDAMGHVRSVVADIRDPDWSAAIDSPISGVIHAAAVTPVQADLELARAADAVAVNVLGTVRVLEWALSRGVGRVVLVSSGRVYGRIREPGLLDEERHLAPDTVYGICKAAAEGLAGRFLASSDLDVVVARLAPLYGPMERPTVGRSRMSTISRWVRETLEGSPLTAPVCPRDYVYVDDVTSSLITLLDHVALTEHVYNVGPGLLYSSEDLVESLSRHASGMTLHAPSADQPERAPLATERLRRDTGWRPEHTLESGVDAYVRWIRSIPMELRS